MPALIQQSEPIANSDAQDYNEGSSAGILSRLGLLEKWPIAFGFGAIFGLSTPGFDIWFLAWVGLVPLLLLIQGCRQRREAAIVGFSFGMGYYLTALRWFLGLHPLNWLSLNDLLSVQAAAAVWVIAAAHQALLITAFAFCVYTIPMRASFLPYHLRPFYPYLLSVPILWIFFMWFVGHLEAYLGTPVVEIAYSQFQQLELIQICKLGGSQLLDFLIVLTNCAIALVIMEYTRLVPKLGQRIDRLAPRGGAIFDLVLIGTVIAIAFAWGRSELTGSADSTRLASSDASEYTPPVIACALQGNLNIEDERMGTTTPEGVAQRYADLAHGIGSSLIVLPEGAITPTQARQGMLGAKLFDVAKYEKKEIVSGSVEAIKDSYVNGVRVISTDKNTLQSSLYVKRRLVPFGEFYPQTFLDALIPSQVKKLMLGHQGGFVAAQKLQLLNSLWGKIGASICVEVIYPKLIANEVRSGASLLVNVSNLAWFHNSPLNKQILASAVMRSVENGRYMILATNTGISAIIDPAGVITTQSFAGKKGIILNPVRFLYRNTPFSKMWWL
jgi:apolipoprotein N-acyltransferase